MIQRISLVWVSLTHQKQPACTHIVKRYESWEIQHWQIGQQQVLLDVYPKKKYTVKLNDLVRSV